MSQYSILGQLIFLGGHFLLKIIRTHQGVPPQVKKSGVFGQKHAFLEPSIILRLVKTKFLENMTSCFWLPFSQFWSDFHSA